MHMYSDAYTFIKCVHSFVFFFLAPQYKPVYKARAYLLEYYSFAVARLDCEVSTMLYIYISIPQAARTNNHQKVVAAAL